MLSSSRRLLTLFLAFVILGPSNSANAGETIKEAPIRFLTDPQDAPDPFSPPDETSVLGIEFGVRPIDGLEGFGLEGLLKSKRPENRVFFVKVVWTISNADGSLVSTVVKRLPIVTPVELVSPDGEHSGGHGAEHSNGGGHGSNGAGHGEDDDGDSSEPGPKLIRIAGSVEWDGTVGDTGSTAAGGTYQYSVTGTLIRVNGKRKKKKRKVLGVTEERYGDVTVETGSGTPLVLAVNAPTNGLITNQGSVIVLGSVTGDEPLAVEVNGTAVAVSSGAFSTSVTLVEGSNSITVVATDGASQTATESVQVTRDSVQPNLVVQEPVPGSSLASATSEIVYQRDTDFSDPGRISNAVLAIHVCGLCNHRTWYWSCSWQWISYRYSSTHDDLSDRGFGTAWHS